MKKLTQSQIIIKFLESEYPSWLLSHQLNSVNTKFGWIGSEGKRRCRELAEMGKIEAVHEGKYVKYRYKNITEQDSLQHRYQAHQDFIKEQKDKIDRGLQEATNREQLRQLSLI